MAADDTICDREHSVKSPDKSANISFFVPWIVKYANKTWPQIEQIFATEAPPMPVSMSTATSSSSSDNNLALILGIIIPVCILVLVVVVGLFVWRRHVGIRKRKAALPPAAFEGNNTDTLNTQHDSKQSGQTDSMGRALSGVTGVTGESASSSVRKIQTLQNQLLSRLL